MTKRYLYILLGLIAVHLALLLIFASGRIIGGDEGFYLNAARMVGLGKIPYIDFFFTQLTLFPLVFSSLASGGWSSFWILRAFAVAAGLLSACLLFVTVSKASRNLKVALIAIGLYSFSGLILSMHSLFEPLVFAQLLALSSYYFWMLYREKGRYEFLILNALSLSALINMRAIFLVLLPLYIISIILVSNHRRNRVLSIYLLTLLSFAVPNLIMMFADFDRFINNTFLFQIFRGENTGLTHILVQKLTVIARTLIDPHLLFIFIAAVVSLILLVRDRKISLSREIFTRPEGMAVANLILIAGVYLVPNPILRHYPEQFLGFALIVTSFNIQRIITVFGDLIAPAWKKTAYVSVLALYLLSLVPYFAIFVGGVRQTDHKYRLADVKSITDELSSLGNESDTVLSEWVGYTFISGQTPLPGTEILGFEYPLPFTHMERMKYKLCDNDYLNDEISRKTPSLVVIVNSPPLAFATNLEINYVREFQTGDVSIYKLR